MLTFTGNTVSDSFVLIDSTVSQWLLPAKLAAIYALISCVNKINKTCHRAVKICNRGGNKKNTSHPGSRFLTASPLCALAFKLLKPPSYAGYPWKRNLQARHAQLIPKSDIFGLPMVARILTAGHGEQRLWVRGWGYGFIWKKITSW